MCRPLQRLSLNPNAFDESNLYHLVSATKVPDEYDSASCQTLQMPVLKSKKRVYFGCVVVRCYTQVLGDNPGCKEGAPVE